MQKTLKRLIALAYLAIAALCLAGNPVLAAGTTPFALVPQTDQGGNIAAGCKLYFYQAGTVATPQDSFADFGLTTKNPWPLTCDQGGRVPMHWLADGLVHLTLIDSSGTTLADTTMQALGPSSGGGGGGGTVDPTTLASTGDVKAKYSTGTISGWVRANGLTIGNATSGATERANSDTQALFIFLYNADASLVVTGGRSGNALTDFNASKQLTLPDMRGRIPMALADMGNSASSVLTATYAGCGVTNLGSLCGSQNHTLVAGEIPAINSSGTTANAITVYPLGNPGLAAPVAAGSVINFQTSSTGSVINLPGLPLGTNWTGSAASFSATNNILANVASTNTGGGAHAIVPPTILMTIYIRL